jgi:hypothetical protein
MIAPLEAVAGTLSSKACHGTILKGEAMPLEAVNPPLATLRASYALAGAFFVATSIVMAAAPDDRHASGSDTPIVREETAGTTAALRYLRSEMDVFHRHTIVYDEWESGGSMFAPTGRDGVPRPGTMIEGQRLTQIEESTSDPHSGPRCLRIAWRPAFSTAWSAVYWQYPYDNQGLVEGLDLTGATQLTFWVRGERGGEVAEFRFGGYNRPRRRDRPFGDSCEAISTGHMELSANWEQYTFSLQHLDLRNIICGFYWRTQSSANPEGCIIYLDDIVIDKSRLDEPRLIRSNHVGATALDRRPHLRHAAVIADNADAINAFLSTGSPEDLERAMLIADAFVELSALETAGRLQNAYRCGALFVRDSTAGFATRPRSPGRVNPGGTGYPSPVEVPWLVDRDSLGTRSAAMARAIVALLNCRSASGEDRYLQTAFRLGQWVIDHCTATDGRPGFTAGEFWNGEVQTLVASRRQTVRDNILLAAAFRRLADSGKSTAGRWEAAFDSAKVFVESVRDDRTQRDHATRTPERGGADSDLTASTSFDVAILHALAMPPVDQSSIWPSEQLIRESAAIVEDLRDAGPNLRENLVSIETAAQTALVLRTLGQDDIADEIVSQLDRLQRGSPTQGALPAVVRNGPDDPFMVFPNLRATSWFVLAHSAWNPMTGESIVP